MQEKALIEVDKNDKVRIKNVLIIPKDGSIESISRRVEEEFEISSFEGVLIDFNYKKYIDLYFAGSFSKQLKFSIKLILGRYKAPIKEWYNQYKKQQNAQTT